MMNKFKDSIGNVIGNVIYLEVEDGPLIRLHADEHALFKAKIEKLRDEANAKSLVAHCQDPNAEHTNDEAVGAIQGRAYQEILDLMEGK